MSLIYMSLLNLIQSLLIDHSVLQPPILMGIATAFLQWPNTKPAEKSN